MWAEILVNAITNRSEVIQAVSSFSDGLSAKFYGANRSRAHLSGMQGMYTERHQHRPELRPECESAWTESV